MRHLDLVFAILATLFLAACGEDDIIDGRIQIISYQCKITLSDSDGKDLAKALLIDSQPLSEGNNEYEVLKGTYQITNPDSKSNGILTLNTSTSPYVMCLSSSVCFDTNKEYENYVKTDYNIVCNNLFGDWERHTLTAYWSYSQCCRIEFNGQSYEPDSNGVVHLTLDK